MFWNLDVEIFCMCLCVLFIVTLTGQSGPGREPFGPQQAVAMTTQPEYLS